MVDCYACVDIELSPDCSTADIRREEEFNLLARNQVPQVYNFSEKMLRARRCEYKMMEGKYKSLQLYKKPMSSVAPLKRYWVHSSMLKVAFNNGWRVTKVHNILTFTAQRVCEDYIQFNQDMRLKYISQGLEFLGLFHKVRDIKKLSGYPPSNVKTRLEQSNYYLASGRFPLQNAIYDNTLPFSRM